MTHSYNTYIYKKAGYPCGQPAYLCALSEGYNTNYFEDCRSGQKRSILSVCEHFAREQDAKRVVLDTFD